MRQLDVRPLRDGLLHAIEPAPLDLLQVPLYDPTELLRRAACAARGAQAGLRRARPTMKESISWAVILHSPGLHMGSSRAANECRVAPLLGGKMPLIRRHQ